MAVVYFTSNASTGVGSLVEALQNASPGDVVRPDETVFERGATIEIALASTLTIDKNLTLDGGPFRVRLNGDGRPRCCSVASGVNVEMTSFDIVGGGWDSQTNANVGSANGAGLNVSSGSEIVLNRCGIFGCRGTYGGGLAISANSTATLNDCIIAGCYARGTCGGLRSQGNVSVYGSTIAGNVEVSPGTSADILVDGSGAGRVTLVNSIVGKYQGNVEIGDGCVVGVASSQIGFVAPPDDLTPETWEANAWQSWNFRLLDDASPTPSPYRDSGDVGAMSRYDLDGNFRGRETSGVATCSPGAYETIQADLFWIGRDATGLEVASPSFLTPDGWASSRFASISGNTAPQTNQTIFVNGVVSFNDTAPQNTSFNIGGCAVVSTGSNTATQLSLSLGLGTTFSLSTSATLRQFGAFAKLNWTSGDLTVNANTTLSALTIPSGSTLTIDGVKVNVNTLKIDNTASVFFSGNDAILAVTENADVSASLFTGDGYFSTPPATELSAATIAETVYSCDYGANVSSFNASRTAATMALLSWSKENQLPSVLLEKADGSGWSVIDNRASGDSFVASVGVAATFRLFDGENFFTSAISSFGAAYELAEEQTIGYLKTLISTGYLN